ncbi:hypothetical protein [Caballeronia humi]|uniref:hypothetical protein n=1 Tax=Caballeronia humi TaxID=326474 RepID=UPI000F74101A|nr:hypothetical protein [Caballeronia humi]
MDLEVIAITPVGADDALVIVHNNSSATDAQDMSKLELAFDKLQVANINGARSGRRNNRIVVIDARSLIKSADGSIPTTIPLPDNTRHTGYLYVPAHLGAI